MELESAVVQGVASGGSLAAALLLYLDRRLVGIEAAIKDLVAATRGRRRPPA